AMRERDAWPRRSNDGAKMRHSNLQTYALISLLLAGVAELAACSSGSDAPSTPSTTSTTAGAGGGMAAGSTTASTTGTATGATSALLGGYGVGAIYNEAIDVAAGIYCVDISAFDGVTFWAKAATAGAKVGVNFVLPETNAVATDPSLGGGDCVSGCYSHPYK